MKFCKLIGEYIKAKATLLILCWEQRPAWIKQIGTRAKRYNVALQGLIWAYSTNLTCLEYQFRDIANFWSVTSHAVE